MQMDTNNNNKIAGINGDADRITSWDDSSLDHSDGPDAFSSPELKAFRATKNRMFPVKKTSTLNELSVDMEALNMLREAKTSPAIPYRLRHLSAEFDGIGRRTRSLAGPSPVCHFGPKAQLFHSDKGIVTTVNDPGTTRLNWSSFPQNVLVVKKVRDLDVLEPFVQLLQYLLEKEMTIFIEQSVLSEEHLLENSEFANMKHKLSTFIEGCDALSDIIDFIICLGGDGTLLYASSLFQTSVPPVMAFHLGSLGFLTPFEFVNFEKRIECVLRGHANLILRSRLHSEMLKDGRERQSMLTMSSSTESSPEPETKTGEDDPHDHTAFVVLNDVVIDRGPSPYLVNLDLFCDGRLITSVQGDGLIISTPTGSTAYAVSAGASIIHPGVPAIMITPICPHSLSFRPIMVPAGCELRVMVSDNARDPAWVSFDGRCRQKLNYGDVLKVTTSIYPLPSVCQTDQIQDWFTGLAGCLHWNVRKPQKPLSNHKLCNGEEKP
ncbi:NAD kinase-like [Paramacrobiotus metropolitanus]|uniref:NAD kinase-like n=1 Tax=Paramacrobiotus metropolitanus TaxID=2943436 RepID=UPI0024465325|nr:NAD kinase-like [Paramacrobiotus metropolitanus]